MLAAPLLADYTPAELLRRLRQGRETLLADPALPAGTRDKLDSVDVSLSLSYDHLEKANPAAAEIFTLLSLFPGGADEAALSAVWGADSLPAVAALRAASLVESDGGRVRLPGPARTYAERRCPAGAWTRCGPPGLAHYLAVAGAGDALLAGHGYDLGLALLLAELPNAQVYYRLGDWHAMQDHKAEAADLYRKSIAVWSAIGMDNLVEQILMPRLQAVQEAPG